VAVVVRHIFARYDDDGDRGDKKYYSGRAMDAVRRLHEDTQRWESKDRAAELAEIKAMQPAVNSDNGLGHTGALSAGSGGGGGDGGGGGSAGGESDAVPMDMSAALAPSTVPASTTFSQPKTQAKSSAEASPEALLPPVALSPTKAVATVVATVSVAKPGKVVLGFGGKRKQLMASGASAFADDDDEDGKKKRKKTKIAVWTDEECVVALMLRGRCRGCCLSHPAAPARSHAHSRT
jgi:hypothetical protein